MSMKPSRPTIFLDTSALISLVDDSAPVAAATRYFALPYDALEAFGDAPILLRLRALTDVSLEAQ